MWNKIKSIFRDEQNKDSVISSSEKESRAVASSDREMISPIPHHKMKLSEAFSFLIKNYGLDCLCGGNLISILNDLTDYEGNRAAKSLLREYVVNHTLSDFIVRPDKDSLERVRQKTLIEYGFNENVTQYVISSIAEATGMSIMVSEDKTVENTATANEPASSFQTPPNVSYIIQFMGLHLGAHINDFKNTLRIKRFRCIYRGRLNGGLVSMYQKHGGDMTDYDLVDWEEYDGQFADQDCMSLVLFATPITHRVFRVDVKMRYSEDKDGEYGRDYIYKRYAFFYDLLTSKYGLPLHEANVDLSASAKSNEGCGLIYNDGKTTLTLMIENALPSTHYFQVVLRYSLNDVPTLALEKAQKAAIIDNENKTHRQQLLSDV